MKRAINRISHDKMKKAKAPREGNDKLKKGKVSRDGNDKLKKGKASRDGNDKLHRAKALRDGNVKPQKAKAPRDGNDKLKKVKAPREGLDKPQRPKALRDGIDKPQRPKALRDGIDKPQRPKALRDGTDNPQKAKLLALKVAERQRHRSKSKSTPKQATKLEKPPKKVHAIAKVPKTNRNHVDLSLKSDNKSDKPKKAKEGKTPTTVSKTATIPKGGGGSSSIAFNLNEVLRIGSVLGRYGTDNKRRDAFDWLASHPLEAAEGTPEAVYNLRVSVGDLPMSKALVTQVVRLLVDKGEISQKEYERHFSILEQNVVDQAITISQFAYFMNVNCEKYKRRPIVTYTN